MTTPGHEQERRRTTAMLRMRTMMTTRMTMLTTMVVVVGDRESKLKGGNSGMFVMLILCIFTESFV